MGVAAFVVMAVAPVLLFVAMMVVAATAVVVLAEKSMLPLMAIDVA